jgi:hypothetical protein
MAMAATAGPAWEVAVTIDADAGSGSFREAVKEANADPSIRSIRFAENVGTLVLTGTVIKKG